MTDRDFVYWLNGFFELNNSVTTLTEEQVRLIKEHLHLVFEHEISKKHEGYSC